MAHAADLPEIAGAATLGAFLADDGELDPAPLVETLAERVSLHLPVIGTNDAMRFRPWHRGTPLTEGRWGIPVPPDRGQDRGAGDLDVVIAPVVAVDRHGTRIGRGAGYYDRALHHRIGRPGRPTIVGYAHQLQLVEVALPRRRWDVPLDVLVTEAGVVRWTEADRVHGTPAPKAEPEGG